MTRLLPSLFQLNSEILARPPINAHIVPVEIAVEILSCSFSLFYRGVCRLELNADMSLDQALLQIADDASEENAEVPIVEPVAHQHQGGTCQSFFNVVRNEFFVF